jgi:hypothetical protein
LHVQVCGESTAELARLGGGRVTVAQHTRLHELDELIPPTPVPGALRVATEDDVDLVGQWFAAFVGDADEQAGRPRGTSAHETPDRAELLRRLRNGHVWFWVDEHGQPVHLTAVNPPVSRRVRAKGVRLCLFTDQANPTSNKIYTALGYRPVVDMANLVIRAD